MNLFMLFVCIVLFVVFGIVENIYNFAVLKVAKKKGWNFQSKRFWLKGVLIPLACLGYIIYYLVNF